MNVRPLLGIAVVAGLLLPGLVAGEEIRKRDTIKSLEKRKVEIRWEVEDEEE